MEPAIKTIMKPYSCGRAFVQYVRYICDLLSQSISCADGLVVPLPMTRQRDTNTLSLIFSDVDHDERDLRDYWGVSLKACSLDLAALAHCVSQ